MQVRPWHAFPVVAALTLVGRDFKIAGGEDFTVFVVGTAIWGGLFAAVIWFFTRKKPAP